ncbi:MAG: BatD family protein [Waddliaceae bacterium]
MLMRYLLFLFLPLSLFSAEFTASVNRKEITSGGSLTLTLKLTGASAKGNPDTSSLKQSFIIHGQRQSSSTVITNGKISSSVTWQLTLISRNEGILTIPSISLRTSEGTLSSDPIQIHVGKRSAGSASANDNRIALTATVSNAKPYKHEPIVYTIRLSSREDLANVFTQRLAVDDAIVETVGELVEEEKIIDGVRYHILSLQYLITPLRAGPLTIPPMVIQGGILSKRQTRSRSVFDDDFGFFQMMPHFDRLESFAESTEETVIEVQPPLPAVTPWLPAASLTIEEKWNESQTLQVGEPLTRSFHLAAEGVKASQLPHLGDLQLNDDGFKIYADKPELGDVVERGVIKSYRDEKYTLIPQQSGALTLPEIIVAWWDVSKKEIAYSRIPPRVLEVLPAPAMHQTALVDETTPAPADSPLMINDANPILYVLIAGLAVLLLFAFILVIALKRKISRLTKAPAKTAAKKSGGSRSRQFKELDSVSTPEELKHFLQSYAEKHWSLSPNIPLKTVFTVAKQRSPASVQQAFFSIEKSLEDALYRDKQIDIHLIAKHCSAALKQAQAEEATVNHKPTFRTPLPAGIDFFKRSS